MTEAIRKVIACNLRLARKEFSRGSLAYAIFLNYGNANESIQVCGRSRSGRWIEKFEAIGHLENFRVKTISSESPLWDRSEYWPAGDPAQCAGLNAKAGRDHIRTVLNQHGARGRALTEG